MRIEVNDGYSQVAGYITWKRLANELFRDGGEIKPDEQVIVFEISMHGINYFVAKRPDALVICAICARRVERPCGSLDAANSCPLNAAMSRLPQENVDG